MNILKLFRHVGLDVQFHVEWLGRRYVGTAGMDNDLIFGNPQVIQWFTSKRDALKWAVSALEEELEPYGDFQAQADVYDLWLDKYVYRITATQHEEKIQQYIHFEVIEE